MVSSKLAKQGFPKQRHSHVHSTRTNSIRNPPIHTTNSDLLDQRIPVLGKHTDVLEGVFSVFGTTYTIWRCRSSLPIPFCFFLRDQKRFTSNKRPNACPKKRGSFQVGRQLDKTNMAVAPKKKKVPWLALVSGNMGSKTCGTAPPIGLLLRTTPI